jgi:hypothetical protein
MNFLLPAPRDRSVFSRAQIGSRVRLGADSSCAGGTGTIVDKTIYFDTPAGPRLELIWVKHRNGTGCFYPRQVASL